MKKNDIIITGDIIYNEETKKQVCAEGKVYAKTWYTINITIPKYQKNKIKQNKYRYNIEIKQNNKTFKIFKSRVKNSINERSKVGELFNTKIYLTKEYKTTEEVTEIRQLQPVKKMVKLLSLTVTVQLKQSQLHRMILSKNSAIVTAEMYIMAKQIKHIQ